MRLCRARWTLPGFCSGRRRDGYAIAAEVWTWARALVRRVTTPLIDKLGMLVRPAGHGEQELTTICQSRGRGLEPLAYGTAAGPPFPSYRAERFDPWLHARSVDDARPISAGSLAEPSATPGRQRGETDKDELRGRCEAYGDEGDYTAAMPQYQAALAAPPERTYGATHLTRQPCGLERRQRRR